MSTRNADSFSEPPPFVSGDRARAWFYNLEGGGIVLDHHVELIQQFFGTEVQYNVTASVNRWSGRLSRLFIEIDLPVDDGVSQDRLVDLQGALVGSEDALVDRSKRLRPFRNISVVLTGRPLRWDAVRDPLDEAGDL